MTLLSAPPYESLAGTLEVQDSAQPYHDWNQAVNAECYAPNMSARILGQAGTISDIINNYEYISFNFGPTLLAWLEHAAPKFMRP